MLMLNTLTWVEYLCSIAVPSSWPYIPGSITMALARGLFGWTYQIQILRMRAMPVMAQSYVPL